jgi:hypothetical protein
MDVREIIDETNLLVLEDQHGGQRFDRRIAPSMIENACARAHTCEMNENV